MRNFVFYIFVGLFLSQPVFSEEFSNLFQPIQFDRLSFDDKRFLQTSLAFEGHYVALIDGEWGNGSNRALAKYSTQELGESPKVWHMAVLTIAQIERDKLNDWDIWAPKGLGLSFLYPFKTGKRGGDSDHMINLEHTRSTLRYSYTVSDTAKAKRLHDFAWESRVSWKEPYTVANEKYVITSIQQANGTVLYIRSDFINGLWSTILLSSKQRDRDTLQAVASSISKGPGRPIKITPNGYLSQNVRQALEYAENLEKDDGAIASGSGSKTQKPIPEQTSSSGSGFWVSKAGIAMTNEHVVNSCSNISVDGRAAKLIASSEQFDLALIGLQEEIEQTPVLFSKTPAGLNADITVVGYPLLGILGGLNVTRGSVSSTTGLLGDGTKMQITAPVQPGNSGGPVFDEHGQIVGVVVSKLNSLNIAVETGDIPQNVNFAIRSEIAKLFMYQNNLPPFESDSQTVLLPENLAELAKDVTVLVECN